MGWLRLHVSGNRGAHVVRSPQKALEGNSDLAGPPLAHRQGQPYTVIAERLNERMVNGLYALLEHNPSLWKAIQDGKVKTIQHLTQWLQANDGDDSGLFVIEGSSRIWICG